jgi:phage terminase small subunit
LSGLPTNHPYSIGHQLLKKREIADLVLKRHEKRIEKLEITADYILGGIRETIERCRQVEPVLDKQGNQTGEYRFDAHAALKGYELLGRNKKLFTDKIEHKIESETADRSDEEIKFFADHGCWPGEMEGTGRA